MIATRLAVTSAGVALLALGCLAAVAPHGAAAAPYTVAPLDGAIPIQYYGAPQSPTYGTRPNYGGQPAQPYGGQPAPQGAQEYGRPAEGGEGLHISDATYTADNRSQCDASRALRDRCEGQASCFVRANDELCGDPARGLRKTLIIGFKCGGKRHEVRLEQHQSVDLHC